MGPERVAVVIWRLAAVTDEAPRREPHPRGWHELPRAPAAFPQPEIRETREVAGVASEGAADDRVVAERARALIGAVGVASLAAAAAPARIVAEVELAAVAVGHVAVLVVAHRARQAHRTEDAIVDVGADFLFTPQAHRQGDEFETVVAVVEAGAGIEAQRALSNDALELPP